MKKLLTSSISACRGSLSTELAIRKVLKNSNSTPGSLTSTGKLSLTGPCSLNLSPISMWITSTQTTSTIRSGRTQKRSKSRKYSCDGTVSNSSSRAITLTRMMCRSNRTMRIIKVHRFCSRVPTQRQRLHLAMPWRMSPSC